MRYILTTAITVAILPAAAAYSQTALNSQTNESPIAALSSALNYDGGTAGTVARNTHDVTAYGNAAITSEPTIYTALDSVQINRATIEARVSSVSYTGQTVQDNHLRAMAYGNLAVLGATESILSSQTVTTTPTVSGVTATTSGVQIGVSVTDGTDPGAIAVSGNSVTSSAVGNSSTYTITN